VGYKRYKCYKVVISVIRVIYTSYYFYKSYKTCIDKPSFLCYTSTMKELKTTIAIRKSSVAKAQQLIKYGDAIGDIYEKALDAYIGLSGNKDKINKGVKRNGRKPKTNTD